MATRYYDYDANGKLVLTGTYTPDRDANGVALNTGTYTPAGSGTASSVTSGVVNKLTGSSGTTSSSSGSVTTTKPSSTGNSQYSSIDEQYITDPTDYAAISAIKAGWGSASDEERIALHKAAEEIRKKYGYSGGEDGSQYIEIPGGATGGFNYSPAPTYNDSYSSQIDAMLDEILNRDKFSYNALEDPLYQQYLQQYQREGQRAMQDTLGQVSARTGGMASSYAVSAAQQANNYYASQAADKIPELYQLAYQMYLDDIDQEVQKYDLLTNASDRQYNRYQDTMNNWREDRNFAYDMYLDDIAREQYKDEWLHELDRETIEDGRYNDETVYNKAWELLDKGVMPDDAMLDAAGISKDQASSILSNSQNGDAYNKAWDLLDRGVMPDDEMLKKAGISAEQAAAIIATNKAKQTSSSSSGSDGGGGKMDYDGLFAAASKDPYSASSFIANNYKKYGFSSSSGLYDAYEEWAANQGGPGGTGEVPSYVLNNLQGFKNPNDVAVYLDNMTMDGVITEQQADDLYAKFMANNQQPAVTPSNVVPLNQRSWSVVDKGGINWGWGVDNNAVVQDQYGNKYRMDDLVDALVGGGMSKSDAKDYVKNLQKQLGI